MKHTAETVYGHRTCFRHVEPWCACGRCRFSSGPDPLRGWQSISIDQRFSIPVLAPHRSAHFVCYSYHFRRLFYSNASALRSGHHTIFLHDSSSKRTYSIHSALKCARREFKLYIFTDVYDVTLVRA